MSLPFVLVVMAPDENARDRAIGQVTGSKSIHPATSCKDSAGERQGALASEKGGNYCDGKGGNLMPETHTPYRFRILVRTKIGHSQVLDL
jgi:hypothetical protein